MHALPIHPHDPWVSGFLGLGRGSGLIPGEFGFIQPFWGTLTSSDLIVGLRNFVATFCMHVHAFDMSTGLSSLSGLLTRGSGPLAGKSRVAEAFVGLFKLLTSLCMCVCVRACPMHPFGSWAFLASPCAALWLSQVSLALLTYLQVYSSCSRCFRCVCVLSACLDSSQTHPLPPGTTLCPQ